MGVAGDLSIRASVRHLGWVLWSEIDYRGGQEQRDLPPRLIAFSVHRRQAHLLNEGAVARVVAPPVTIGRVLDTLDGRYRMLHGTIRDYGTGQRRAFLRFFACEEDWSHESMGKAMPEVVANGSEPLLIIGAIPGG
jgi:molybdopterin synthase sulfur carrier subunit